MCRIRRSVDRPSWRSCGVPRCSGLPAECRPPHLRRWPLAPPQQCQPQHQQLRPRRFRLRGPDREGKYAIPCARMPPSLATVAFREHGEKPWDFRYGIIGFGHFEGVCNPGEGVNLGSFHRCVGQFWAFDRVSSSRRSRACSTCRACVPLASAAAPWIISNESIRTMFVSATALDLSELERILPERGVGSR